MGWHSRTVGLSFGNLRRGHTPHMITDLDTIALATGAQRPSSWLGPEYGESSRIPNLLAQAGIPYGCGWVNDEQPYRIRYLDEALQAMLRRRGVWAAHGRTIIEWYRQHQPTWSN